ncbi:MAG: HEAT repeat domain-containing protein [Myxococcota bacterium]
MTVSSSITSRSLQSASFALTVVLFSASPHAETADRDARDRALFSTYEAMLRDDPYQPYALRRLLEVSHTQGGLSGVITTYEGRAKATPDQISTWVVLGHLYRAGDRHPQAVDAYKKAATGAPKDWRPHLALARLWRHTHDWTDSFAAFDSALSRARKRDDRITLWQEAADTALEAKSLQRALSYYSTLRDATPRKPFVHMEAAATLSRRGFPRAALTAWLEVQEAVGSALKHRVVVWRQVATLQEELGDLSAAEATWREGLKALSSSHWARPAFLEGLVSVYRRKDALPALVEELERGRVRDRHTQLTLAHLYEELGRDDLARRWLEKALANNTRDVATRLRLIRILERTGPPKALLAQHEALVKVARGEPRHELNLAHLYFQQDETTKGFRLLDTLGRRYRNDPGVHQRIIDLTMRYGGDKERPRIERTYRTLMKLEPREEGHIISLGEYWWSTGDRERAKRTWHTLGKLAAKSGAGHLSHAEVLRDHGLIKEARKAYEAAIAKSPDDPRFLRAFATFLEQQKESIGALAAWRRVLDTESQSAKSIEARRRVVQLWQRAGTLRQKERELTARFDAKPPDLEAGFFLVEVVLLQRNDTRAQAVLERLRQLAPKRLETLTALEQLYTRSDRVVDAIEVLETLARLNPREAYDYLHRAADLALARGDLKGALETTRRVVALNPAAPTAHDRVGDLYRRMGRMQESIEAWRQVLLLDPRNDTVRFKLADMYRTLEQPDRERQELIHIVRETPQPSDALKAGRRLLQVAIATRGLRDVEDALRPLAVRRSGRSDVYLKLLIDVFLASARAIRWSGPTKDIKTRQLEALGERALRPLLEALTGADVALRARALEVIGATHPPGAVPALTRILLGQSPAVRLTVAAALGAIGTASAVDALGRLYDEATGHGQRVAIWALGLARAPKAQEKLAEIANSRHPQHRILAAWAMGARADPSATPTLKRLARSADVRQRIAAVWALGQTPSPAVELTLGGALASADPLERRLASRGLNAVGTTAAQRRLIARLWRADGRPIGHLGMALTSVRNAPDLSEVRDVYAAMIDEERGRLSTDRGLLIATTLPAPPSATERLRRAVTLLPLLEARLTSLLRNGTVEEINEALDACLGPHGALMLHPLIPATTNQSQVQEVLTRLWESSRDALVELAGGSAGGSAQAKALQLLSRLEPAAMTPTVVGHAKGALQSPWPELQSAAIAVLAHAPPPDSATASAHHAHALMDWYLGAERSTEVRAAMARASGVMTAPQSPMQITIMQRLLRDKGSSVRLAAIRSAKARDLAPLLPTLADLINDPIADVAREALDALRRSGHPAARALLSAAQAAHKESPVWRGSSPH